MMILLIYVSGEKCLRNALVSSSSWGETPWTSGSPTVPVGCRLEWKGPRAKERLPMARDFTEEGPLDWLHEDVEI